MARFILQRLLEAIPTLLIVSVVVFTLIRMAPGDPAMLRMGREAARPENKPKLEALRHEMGLDRPIPVQYLFWLRDTVTGNFGVSIKTSQPAIDLVLSKVPVTLELVLAATLFAILIAFPGGLLAAIWRGSWVDRATMAFAASGLAVPSFWLGLALILIFSVQLHWLPASGYTPFFTSPFDNLRRLVLPTITLGVYLAAVLIRFLRADMIEVLATDYIRTARAKGLGRQRVIFTHALKNALIPVLTVGGLEVGALLGGAVIIEQVFGWSGMGWLTVQAIFDRDYAVVQTSVLLFVVGLTLMNLLVDLSYAFLNPRVRASFRS
ncbi:MAG: ABC transporter permease [Caldilineaceae bacterium]